MYSKRTPFLCAPPKFEHCLSIAYDQENFHNTEYYRPLLYKITVYAVLQYSILNIFGGHGRTTGKYTDIQAIEPPKYKWCGDRVSGNNL